MATGTAYAVVNALAENPERMPTTIIASFKETRTPRMEGGVTSEM